ncbi:MAG: helix-hairpin-helix domain-containing protein [Acidobacteriota bacterium]|nr:MAG: helix-hairpin-helix domain-containing protein [Acidobacteriota bacterium]
MKNSIFQPFLLVCLAMFLLVQAPVNAVESKVDLNTADSAELETLPGIGAAIAKRIIEYREENGPFRRPEDLMNVRGIGEKKFLALRDLVTVSSPKSKQKANPPNR